VPAAVAQVLCVLPAGPNTRIQRLKALGGVVGVFPGSALECPAADIEAQILVGEQPHDGACKADRVSHRYSDRGIRRPFHDVPHGGAYRGYPKRRGFQKCQRARLVSRRDDHQVGSRHHRVQLSLGQKAEEIYPLRQSQLTRKRLYFPLQRIVTDDMHLEADPRCRDRRERPKQRRLVLHPVEARYLELAVPTEFDGIRTQIAQEIGIPKKAVKKIVKDLRERQSIPSWWELQTYKGSSEELEKIKAAYVPYLPLPPIGVHKTIADELTLNPGEVYQAIKSIRLEMNLPQYNDPSLHGLEPITGAEKRPATLEEETKEPQEEKYELDAATLETQGTPAEVEMTLSEKAAEPVEVATSSAVDTSNTQE